MYSIHNQVLSECDVPVRLYIYCIEELRTFHEDLDAYKRGADFEEVKGDLLNTADIGILMCGTFACNDSMEIGGMARNPDPEGTIHKLRPHCWGRGHTRILTSMGHPNFFDIIVP